MFGVRPRGQSWFIPLEEEISEFHYGYLAHDNADTTFFSWKVQSEMRVSLTILVSGVYAW